MGMYYEWLALSMANIELSLLALALVLTITEWLIQLFLKRSTLSAILYRWLILLPVGGSLIYVAIMNGFYSEAIASSLKWHISPFQFYVGIANAVFGILAITSFFASHGFRKATVFATTLWLWGNIGIVINEMVVRSHYHFDDLGASFWLYLLIPFVLMICLTRSKYPHRGATKTPSKTTNLSL